MNRSCREADVTAGYVYVLVNSSMPGLVKVGKTARLPSERVQELSRATGVATPFVVAFEQWFDDCDAAENLVHAELERRGLREAANREFFRATANEVIRAIIAASDIARPSLSAGEIYESSVDEPWADLMAEADALSEGLDDTIQDVEEAVRVYKLAARLGAPEACRRLGEIFAYGAGVGEDEHEAFKWFREGAKRGDFVCHFWMARMFCRQQSLDSAVKSLRLFFKQYGDEIQSSPERSAANAYWIEAYVHLCLDNRLPIEFPQYIADAREAILSRVLPRLTDRLTPAERQELTRVRDTLIATRADNSVPALRGRALGDSTPSLLMSDGRPTTHEAGKRLEAPPRPTASIRRRWWQWGRS